MFSISATQCVRLPVVLRAKFLAIALMAMQSSSFAGLGDSLSLTGISGAHSASSPVSPLVNKKSAGSAFTSRLTTLPNGTEVTEYANADSVVFAVVWSGPVLPDFASLLGLYFSDFKTESANNRPQRTIGTPLRIDTPQLKFQSSGRMGNFSGYAYAPPLIPTGWEIGSVLP